MTTQTLTSEIESFRQNAVLSSLETEFLNCGDEERKTNINELIDEIRGRNKILDTTGKSQINDIFDKINEMTLSQPWNKIPENKKNILINQYAAEFENDEEKRIQLIGVLTATILTIKMVEYDTKNKKIISIDRLKINDDGLYYIEKIKAKAKVVKDEQDDKKIKAKIVKEKQNNEKVVKDEQIEEEFITVKSKKAKKPKN